LLAKSRYRTSQGLQCRPPDTARNSDTVCLNRKIPCYTPLHHYTTTLEYPTTTHVWLGRALHETGGYQAVSNLSQTRQDNSREQKVRQKNRRMDNNALSRSKSLRCHKARKVRRNDEAGRTGKVHVVWYHTILCNRLKHAPLQPIRSVYKCVTTSLLQKHHHFN
jgi:hypothetical protein